MLKKSVVIMNKKFKPKLFWIDYKFSHPERYCIVIALLSVCPSEASAERSFSIHYRVYSSERNRLDDTQIEAEMIIKMNYVKEEEI
jgi:hypothetical protein